MTNVKSIVTPHGGQSVNPTLQAHREILKKVVSEEEKQIEDNYRGSLQHSIHGAKASQAKLKEMLGKRLHKDKDEDDESEIESESESEASESDGELSASELPGQKPVDRLKKLTKN